MAGDGRLATLEIVPFPDGTYPSEVRTIFNLSFATCGGINRALFIGSAAFTCFEHLWRRQGLE